MTGTWSWLSGPPANWSWLAAALLVPTALALALLQLGLRTRDARSVASLQQRALACLVLVVLGCGVGVAHAGVQIYGVLHGSSSIDPAARARVLAEGISSAMNYVAVGLLATPAPIAVYIVLFVRRRRLARPEPAPSAAP